MIDEQLNALEQQRLDNLLWSNDGYKPHVTFAIAHGNDRIYLRYRVFEDDMSAVHLKTNDLVYEDTCVEFFIAIGNDAKYYNIEFNRLGTCFMAYAGGKNDMHTLPADVISDISTHSQKLQANNGFKHGWQLTLVIPAAVFIYHPGIEFEGLACRGNFYKCGDKLSRPHFLSWSDVRSQGPDFHRPEYFGELRFRAPDEKNTTTLMT